MPNRPRKTCPCPGCPQCLGRCPNLTLAGRCPDCIPQRSTSSADDDRRVYQTKRWKGLRRTKLQADPWCEHEGCLAPATVVDHHIAIADGGPDFPPLDQLNSLCVPHHNAKTARELARRTRPR